MIGSSARCLAALVSLAVLSLAPCGLALLPAQDPPTAPPPTQKPDAEKAKPADAPKLTAWPAPADKEQVLTDVERVVKARIPEMATGGRDGLVAAGASAVPFVLQRYGREKDEQAAGRLHEVLVAITAADQTRLLAEEFDSKHVPVRTFVLWRTSCFPDPALRNGAEKAWARVQKQGEKADPEERYAAALCTASTGSTLGLDALYEACGNKRWDRGAKEIRAALDGVRGVPASDFALAKLANADRKTKVTVLRMLAGCGDKSHAAKLRGFLDEEDNSIRVATINALRGMVDGEPPLEGLSAFEAIEMAGKWKARAL